MFSFIFKVITNLFNFSNYQLRFSLLLSLSFVFSLNVLPCNNDLILSHAKHKIYLKAAINGQQKMKGLSGVKFLKKNHGMFFYYHQIMDLQFWMIDTFIDLDIFFLNSNLLVIGIARNQAKHPGSIEPPKIARTKSYTAKYVFELSSKDPLSKKIKVGNQLKFICSKNFQQIKQGIRLKR